VVFELPTGASHDARPALGRNLKLTIEYDGTGFSGWQRQSCARTVQGVLVDAITALTRETVELSGASRTDRGVHAAGQVASFLTTSRIPTDRFARALNGVLPGDVRVRAAEEVAPAFHARFSALGKHYRYLVDTREPPSVFLSFRALHHPGSLNLEAMREAAALVTGEHDFASFQCAETGFQGSTVRTLFSVRLSLQEGLLRMDVRGRSFLYKMVRTLAGSLLEVGRGKWSLQRFQEGFLARDRTRMGPTLPGHGLCLRSVYYDPETLERDLAGGSGKALEHEEGDLRSDG
jgi:tRNA pseudouridine38-40 synthase